MRDKTPFERVEEAKKAARHWTILYLFFAAMAGILISTLVIELTPQASSKKESSVEDLQREIQVMLEASEEVDRGLSELRDLIESRQEALAQREAELQELETQLHDTEIAIEDLEGVRLEAVEYLLGQTAEQEARSRRRDYFLFFAGVVSALVIEFGLRRFDRWRSERQGGLR